MSEKTLYVCDYNLRPRINGAAVLIPSGEPFDKGIINKGTFEAFLETGAIRIYEEEIKDAEIIEEVPAEDVVDESQEFDWETSDDEEALIKYATELGIECDARATPKSLKKKIKAALVGNKPQGIFNKNVEDLAELDIDELDAMHAEICAENGLDAPEPFESIEKAIEKLTREA